MDKRIELLYRGIQKLDYVHVAPHGYIIPFSSIIKYVERHELVQNLSIVDVFLNRLQKDGRLELIHENFDPDLIAGVRLK